MTELGMALTNPLKGLRVPGIMTLQNFFIVLYSIFMYYKTWHGRMNPFTNSKIRLNGKIEGLIIVSDGKFGEQFKFIIFVCLKGES